MDRVARAGICHCGARQVMRHHAVRKQQCLVEGLSSLVFVAQGRLNGTNVVPPPARQSAGIGESFSVSNDACSFSCCWAASLCRVTFLP
jgi:hypothetical protein